MIKRFKLTLSTNEKEGEGISVTTEFSIQDTVSRDMLAEYLGIASTKLYDRLVEAAKTRNLVKV